MASEQSELKKDLKKNVRQKNHVETGLGSVATVEFLRLWLTLHRRRHAVTCLRLRTFLKGDTPGPHEIDEVSDERCHRQETENLEEEEERRMSEKDGADGAWRQLKGCFLTTAPLSRSVPLFCDAKTMEAMKNNRAMATV